MSDFCALCGNKLPLFGSKSLVCANEYEMFCPTCCDKIYPMDNPGRGRYLLEHGRPTNPEAMREFLAAWEKREEHRAKLEPPTRLCPGCGGPMVCKPKGSRIVGYTGKLFNNWYDVDLFACPDCGKAELYTADFAAVQAARERQTAAEEQTAKEPAQPEFISRRPGQGSGGKPPWEK